MPLVWTQSWLDPNVELGALKETIKIFEKPITTLVIAGGGDLPLNLLVEPAIREVVCLDRSGSQLAVLELKANLCNLYPKLKDRIDFLEGKTDSETFQEMYQIIKRRLTSTKVWSRDQRILSEGLLCCDRLRLYFQTLPYREWNYSKVFTNKRMIRDFGIKFIKHSLGFRFDLHFQQVMQKHRKVDPENYFYQQMTKGYYHYHYPPYLTNEHLPIHKLTYMQNDLKSYLIKSKRKYEFISLSNITDELGEDELDVLLQLVHRALKHRGRLVLRRMSGETQLHPIVNRYFIIITIDRPFLVDKTYLYQEVILATPRLSKPG